MAILIQMPNTQLQKILVFAFTFIAMTALFNGATLRNNLVGVRKGDWIQYNVSETGNPPPEYNITWARMDITGVHDEAINVSVQTLFGNGTLYSESYVPLNIATGAIGDGFFIPTNLNPGDNYTSQYEGIISITGVEELNLAGEQRTVFVGVTNQTTYYWDKQTGIMVAATSNLPGCTLYTKTGSTNIWQPQIIGLNQTVFYILVAIIAAVLIALILVSTFLFRRHLKN